MRESPVVGFSPGPAPHCRAAARPVVCPIDLDRRGADVTGRLAGVPLRLGLLAGGAGYLIGALAWVAMILRSPSSTAAIGFVFVPFVAFVPGVLSFAVGYSGAFLWQRWRTPELRFSIASLVSATVLWVVLGGGSLYLAKNLRVMRVVDVVRTMDSPELSRYFERGPLRRNKFVLGAIAQSPAADGELLDRVAHLDDASLHIRMGALFPLLGENRRGLAVMRLVARHENVEEQTLVWLSQSPNDYVVGDVASNEKTPVEILQQLHARGGYLIEWGLAANEQTPSLILHALSDNSNQYARDAVASNPGTAASDLARLAGDSIWHVRRGVAMNPIAPHELLERLAEDSDDRVGRVARHRLKSVAPTPH